jgi:glucokinase
MTNERPVIAVDLGGTKISVALIDATGKMLVRRKRLLQQRDASACAQHIAQSIREIGDARGVGLIVPGIYFAETGDVWAPNLWGDERVPLRSELEQVLKMPVVIDSDRVGYVLGENWMGAAQGLKDVVFLSIGTGIGAGILADGRLLRGAGDIAGAVGWFAFGPQQQELHKLIGCWEAEAAGPALARRARAKSAEEVAAAARTGDPDANRAIAETAEYLAMGVANIVSILNPEMIVLGGGLMQAGDLFLKTITARMTNWAQPIAARQVRIELTRLGEDAGLLGAARLALNHSSL